MRRSWLLVSLLAAAGLVGGCGNSTVEVKAGPVSPSPTAPPTAVPSSGSNASTQTPSPADTKAASDAVDHYTADLVSGDFASAYAMLAPEAQRASKSIADFTYERGAFFKSVAGHYTIRVAPTDVAPIASWLPATYGAPIDLGHAVLIEVDYPALAGNNAGYELYIVNPQAGGLELFNVR